jgi:hypothetical protein
MLAPVPVHGCQASKGSIGKRPKEKLMFSYGSSWHCQSPFAGRGKPEMVRAIGPMLVWVITPLTTAPLKSSLCGDAKRGLVCHSISTREPFPGVRPSPVAATSWPPSRRGNEADLCPSTPPLLLFPFSPFPFPIPSYPAKPEVGSQPFLSLGVHSWFNLPHSCPFAFIRGQSPFELPSQTPDPIPQIPDSLWLALVPAQGCSSRSALRSM